MKTVDYDRPQAVAYARKWAFGRNSQYYDFSGLGGDCTNFVSQCLYAGSKVMNFIRLTLSAVRPPKGCAHKNVRTAQTETEE